jgi:hypothetical protein
MLELLFLLNDYGYVASTAAHDVGTPTGAWSHSPVGYAVSSICLGYAQSAGLKTIVVLGVGDGGTDCLGHDAGVGRWHEAQNGHRLVHTLAADLVKDKPRLLGSDGGVA